MTFFSFKSPSLIGLDIQPYAVRLVQLAKRKRGYLAQQVAVVNLPAGVFVDGKIKQWDVLLTTLSALVERLGLKGRAAAINLPANLVRMQRMQLPVGLSDNEIESEIHAKMQKDLPGMNYPLSLDFQVKTEINAPYMDVFFAAARLEYLSQYKQCVNASGLQIKIIDVDIYALKRAMYFALQLERLESETNAWVSLFNDTASLIVFNAQDIIFHQQWDVRDKADFLNQLKNRMQIGLAAFRELDIHKVLLCAARDDFATLTEELTPTWAYQLCCPNPFERIELAQGVESTLMANHPVDFLVAFGAAMRDVPAW